MKNECITLLLSAITHMTFGGTGENVWLHLLDSATAWFTNIVGGKGGNILPATLKTMCLTVIGFVLFLRKSLCHSFVQTHIVMLYRKE